MLPCVLLIFCAISCQGGGNSVTETIKDNNDESHPSSFSTGSDEISSEKQHPKMVLRSPPDEDLLELMVRIAETPEEWERIHTVLKELGIEKRRSQEKHNDQNSSGQNTTTTTANITQSSSSRNNSSLLSPSPSSPSSLFSSSSRLEEKKNYNNRSTPDRIEEFAKNNSTRRARVRSVVGTKFRKKKKGARRKEQEEERGDDAEGEGRGGLRQRQHHDHHRGVWPKLHRAKKKERRRIEARSTAEEEGRKEGEREEQGREEMGETYNWFQLIKLRHDKVDDPGPKERGKDLLEDQDEEDYREEEEEEKEEDEEDDDEEEMEDNHVSWVPSVDSSPLLRSTPSKSLTDAESQQQNVDNNLPADSSADANSISGSVSSSSSSVWSDKDRVRPTFSYHRVTASPRERERTAAAYVAVSVVKNNATALEHSHHHKTHPAPWSHARHLHRIQEQLKSLSVTKAKLRHHWFEKEEMQNPIFDDEQQQGDSTS